MASLLSLFPLWAEVGFDHFLVLAILDRELNKEWKMIAGKVPVWEAGYALEVVWVHIPEKAGDLQCVRRIPDIVEDTDKSWRVVGEFEFTDVRVTGLQTEWMRHAIAGEVAVSAITQVFVEMRQSDLTFPHILGTSSAAQP